MARIARLVMYVFDPNGNEPIADRVDVLIHRHDSGLHLAAMRGEEKEFEWDDGLIINQVSVDELDVAKFYRELPKGGGG